MKTMRIVEIAIVTTLIIMMMISSGWKNGSLRSTKLISFLLNTEITKNISAVKNIMKTPIVIKIFQKSKEPEEIE